MKTTNKIMVSLMVMLLCYGAFLLCMSHKAIVYRATFKRIKDQAYIAELQKIIVKQDSVLLNCELLNEELVNNVRAFHKQSKWKGGLSER